MRIWKKFDGSIVCSSIVVLASCVAGADAAWWGVAKEKLNSSKGGGG